MSYLRTIHLIHKMNITDNVIIYNELCSKFMKRNIQIPVCQRSYITERIDYFYNKLSNKDKYIGLIHCALWAGNMYIVDGQHRYYAYKKQYENNNDITIPYVVKLCNTRNEINEYFKELNNVINLESIILDDFDESEIIKNHIKQNYGKHISHSEKPLYPNINIDQVVKYVLLKFSKSKDIIGDFEKLNKDIMESVANNEKYNKTKQGLYIGYLFQKTENDNKRKQIPTGVRHKLWTNHFNDSIIGNCTVCKFNIDITNFHCGHIISVKNGGTDNITNLTPLCSGCNLSMGTQNVNDYKHKYF